MTIRVSPLPTILLLLLIVASVRAFAAPPMPRSQHRVSGGGSVRLPPVQGARHVTVELPRVSPELAASMQAVELPASRRRLEIGPLVSDWGPRSFILPHVSAASPGVFAPMARALPELGLTAAWPRAASTGALAISPALEAGFRAFTRTGVSVLGSGIERTETQELRVFRARAGVEAEPAALAYGRWSVFGAAGGQLALGLLSRAAFSEARTELAPGGDLGGGIAWRGSATTVRLGAARSVLALGERPAWDTELRVSVRFVLDR